MRKMRDKHNIKPHYKVSSCGDNLFILDGRNMSTLGERLQMEEVLSRKTLQTQWLQHTYLVAEENKRPPREEYTAVFRQAVMCLLKQPPKVKLDTSLFSPHALFFLRATFSRFSPFAPLSSSRISLVCSRWHSGSGSCFFVNSWTLRQAAAESFGGAVPACTALGEGSPSSALSGTRGQCALLPLVNFWLISYTCYHDIPANWS